MDETWIKFKGLMFYLARRLAWFERTFSPAPSPRPKAVPVDAVDYGNVQVVHVHHYIHEAEKPKPNFWEEYYHWLVDGL